MVDLKILDAKLQAFINDNIGKSISKLALQKNPFEDVEWRTILNQIEAKTKAKDKLPTWFLTQDIVFPNKISIEQTSSERTAHYKASLISGESLIDLTGGFGVDDYYFAQKVQTVAHCEINYELSTLAQYNFTQLNVSNIKCHAGDSLTTLSTLNQKWNWIYIDPSRRNEAKGKVFMLKDCMPNVPDNLDFYFKFSSAILIKTAPILDISAGLSEGFVTGLSTFIDGELILAFFLSLLSSLLSFILSYFLSFFFIFICIFIVVSFFFLSLSLFPLFLLLVRQSVQ
jgi:hypothetical protein